jgi:lysozyme
MKTAKKGIDLIKFYESFKEKAYKCPAGVWTIGYGHTRTTQRGQTINENQAIELLMSDLQFTEISVKKQALFINQNQFDALVSFSFNVGSGAFTRSTLLKKIKSGADEVEIRHQFNRWNKSGGVILNGLVSRRKAEGDLYFETEFIGDLDPKTEKRL